MSKVTQLISNRAGSETQSGSLALEFMVKTIMATAREETVS